MKRHSDSLPILGFIIFAVVILAVGLILTIALRNHGASTCTERRGTPVYSSWLSEDAWDVKCLEGNS